MTEPITKDDLPEYGPKMMALSPRHRAFVAAYHDDRAGSSVRARLQFAALEAGYKCKVGRNAENQGWRAASYPGVREAMDEEGKRRNRLHIPIARSASRAILDDPKHRDHGKLVMYYLSLDETPGALLNVKVEHVAPTLEMTEAVKVRIAALAAGIGVALPAPPTIEGEFVEVSNDR